MKIYGVELTYAIKTRRGDHFIVQTSEASVHAIVKAYINDYLTA